MKESSDHIDRVEAKAKSIPFVISISHAVYKKLVRLSTFFLIEQNNQCFTYISQCEKHNVKSIH